MNIKKKIVVNTLLIVMVVAVVLMLVMTASMKTLTNEVMQDVLPSMIKTASQNIEANMHMLADRIFMIGDNDVITQKDSSLKEKRDVLRKAQSGIEFVWLGLYDAKGKLYLGDQSCPKEIGNTAMFPLLGETQNLVIDDVTSSDGQLEFAVGIPIMSNEELLYYLVGNYKYDILNDVMTNINLSVNADAYIVNQEGKIMGNRDQGLVAEQANIQDETKLKGLLQKVSSGVTGVSLMEASGKTSYVSYAPINGTRWYLAVIVPQNDFMGPADESILFSMAVTGILLALAIIFTFRFSSKIQKSLKKVTGRIGLLAKGDLKTPTEIIRSKDETGALSQALSDTVESINGYISELSDILESMSGGNFKVEVQGTFDGDFVVMKESLNKIISSMNQMLKSMKKSSQEVLMTANIVSESAGQVHNGSTEQSNSLNVLSQETAAIEKNIQDVDSNTSLVGNLMGTAKESIGMGNENMTNLLDAMENINRNAMEITKITKYMEDISFQTNILALNASVEASRAGSAGAGFAVVAEEVRNLAAQSADSSQHTTEMINESLEAIKQGAVYAKKVAESFHDIEEVSNDISVITERLSESVGVQKNSLENMSGQIAQIRDFAQQNLDASYESSTASKKLNKQAQHLQYVSGQFKLREDGEI